MAAPKIWPTGQQKITVDNDFQVPVNGPGPQSTMLPAYGGTFTANGATGVDVVNPNVTANSMILIGLKTPDGTVGAIPVVQTKTAGTGFNVKGTALDTSVYFYLILG